MKLKTNRLIQTASFLFLFCLLSIASFGQTKQTALNKIYLQIGAGSCSHKGMVGEFDVQAAFKNNWIASFSYHNLEMDDKNVPSDYDPGEATFLFIPLGGSMPTIEMNTYSLTAGKYTKTGKNTWLSAEGGISLVKGEKINYTRNTGDLSAWSLIIISGRPSNYITTVENKTTMGGMLKANFNWAFASFAGLGAGVFANVNSIQSAVGYEVKLSLGWMNRTKKVTTRK
ncbi:MAG TPA: hypothetical protein VGQ09_13245 [Chitinophagaceae bacterium]|jgi:hypothetical protein|nr:hypothetical protein [Chitinophagaceae bacterium]